MVLDVGVEPGLAQEVEGAHGGRIDRQRRIGDRGIDEERGVGIERAAVGAVAVAVVGGVAVAVVGSVAVGVAVIGAVVVGAVHAAVGTVQAVLLVAGAIGVVGTIGAVILDPAVPQLACGQTGSEEHQRQGERREAAKDRRHGGQGNRPMVTWASWNQLLKK